MMVFAFWTNTASRLRTRLQRFSGSQAHIDDTWLHGLPAGVEEARLSAGCRAVETFFS